MKAAMANSYVKNSQCSNKTLFVEREIWIPYNFYVLPNVTLILIYLSTLWRSETCTSSQATPTMWAEIWIIDYAWQISSLRHELNQEEPRIPRYRRGVCVREACSSKDHDHLIIIVGIKCHLLNLTHHLCLCPFQVPIFTHHTHGSALSLFCMIDTSCTLPTKSRAQGRGKTHLWPTADEQNLNPLNISCFQFLRKSKLSVCCFLKCSHVKVTV